ncbi:hypothetical protein [Streptosporangium sp. NBC_01469]|uniref:hypothetical protein n=1 Tax=Streptosporangium sp. NBC_01469 TaxID=2903898 RepID=UPI002E2B0961|nr:hypothetical protein [Streptosporangium sp. NBC_01469]
MREGGGRNHGGVAARRAGIFGLVAVLVSGCTAGAGEAGTSRPLRIMAASGEGAVLFDPATGAMSGHLRSGGRAWQDRESAESGANVTCVARCPDVAVSQTPADERPAMAPFLLTGKGRSPFAVSAAERAHVLSARSVTDAVVEEADGSGHSWIRVARPGGTDRVKAGHRGYQWVESTDGNVGFAFPWRAEKPASYLLRFVRGADGWRLSTSAAKTVAEACVAVAIADRGECVTGDRAAAVVTRSMDGQGGFATTVRGLGPDGRIAWRREFATEAGVTAHPTGPSIGISDGDTFTLLDPGGRTVRERSGVMAARFTPQGELVLLSPTGEVEWLPAGSIERTL